MFIKDKNSQEGLIHVCEGLTEKKMREKAIEINLHDIHIRTFVYEDKNKMPKMEYIKFCPYCGCDLEKDAFKN